ncbi:MAG: hypothetical protein JNL66_15000 [Alphaproteobacteria bacterium]|nr:hypothetical protein [Alphaproteobacteria bacterium]
MTAAPRDRVRSLRLHIIVALGALLVLIPLNLFTTPRNPWWLYVLMAWMPLIAGHAAWAMGMFGNGNRRDTEAPR